jgi:ATP-binding cassette subfamily B protein
MKNFFRLMVFFKEIRWRVFWVIALGSVSIIMFAFMPSYLRASFNVLSDWMGGMGVSHPMQSVILNLTIFGVLAIFNALFDIFCQVVILRAENDVIVKSIIALKRKLDVVPVSFLERFTVGDLSRRVTSVASEIITNLLQTVYTISRVSVFFITTSIMMFYINPILAAIVVLSLPICIITAKIMSKFSQKYFNAHGKQSADSYAFLNQKFALQDFYNMHGIDDGGAQFNIVNERHKKTAVGADTATAFNTVYINFIQNIMYLVVTFVFGVLYVTQVVPTEFGVLPAFIMYSNRFLSNAVVVTTATTLIQTINSVSYRFFEIYDYKENVTQNEHINIQKIKLGITFTDVSMDTDGLKLLNKVSFHIAQGHSVAFVGPAGSGKTHIVDLLSKLALPTGGKISVDGIDLSEITSKSYYKCVGISTEKPFIFRGTVAENLLYGVRRELPENVMAITEKLGSHRFIESLENGYETWLSDNTPLLGLGQRQSVCVARLVLQNPDVIIFYQSLSAADIVTEKDIFEKIMKMNKGQTKIFVTNRLASVEKCDVIHYVENGRIIESGTHKALMAAKKRYYNAYVGE